MFRRRRDRDGDSTESPETESPDASIDEVGESVERTAAPPEEGKPERPEGPWDAAEVDLEDPETKRGRLDLGALVIKGRPAMQLRLDVDQQTRRVRSVTFVAEGAALQLQAFAAPRSAPLWPDVRSEIAADCERRGGTAAELEGPYGTELRLTLPVTTPDGKSATQSSRIAGIDGPRWLLRASFLGKAVDPDLAGDLAAVLRDVIVVRGQDPMAPRDMLVLQMPAGSGVGVAEPVDGAGTQDGRPSLSPFRRGPEITEIR